MKIAPTRGLNLRNLYTVVFFILLKIFPRFVIWYPSPSFSNENNISEIPIVIIFTPFQKNPKINSILGQNYIYSTVYSTS